MDFCLTEDQQMLRHQITRFAREQLSCDVREADANQVFPKDAWNKCGAMRLQGLPIPVEFGGVGLDAMSTVVSLEALGQSCDDGGLVFSLCAHMLAGAVPIARFGSIEQKEKYLPGLCDGRLIACNGTTEADSGSNAFSMTTRAVLDDDGFIISGRKIFCSNGPEADLALIYAVTDPSKGFIGGATAFLVETNLPGFSHGQRFETVGLRTCPLAELVLDDVRVGHNAVLGQVGQAGLIFMHAMQWERIGLSAANIGRMDRLLEATISYVRQREVGGKKVGQFQAIAHRVADMKVRVEAARMLTYKAAALLDSSADATMFASIAKLFTSETLIQVATEALHLHGAYGFTVDCNVERYLRDALGATTYSGTSEVQRNIIAQWLGLHAA